MKYLHFFLFMLATTSSAGTAKLYTPSPTLRVVSENLHLDFKTSKTAEIIGEVNTTSQIKFQFQMESTKNLKGDRIIVINSPGGTESRGRMMIDSMDAERAVGVKQICIVDGEAASMAFNILTHCDIRLSTNISVFMFHKIALSYVTATRDKRLTARNLRALASDLEKDDKRYDAVNAKALGLTAKEYDAIAAKDEMFLSHKLFLMGYLQGFGYIKN